MGTTFFLQNKPAKKAKCQTAAAPALLHHSEPSDNKSQWFQKPYSTYRTERPSPLTVNFYETKKNSRGTRCSRISAVALGTYDSTVFQQNRHTGSSLPCTCCLRHRQRFPQSEIHGQGIDIGTTVGDSERVLQDSDGTTKVYTLKEQSTERKALLLLSK